MSTNRKKKILLAIPPGVTFFSLPYDWLWPEYSAGKNEFALVELKLVYLIKKRNSNFQPGSGPFADIRLFLTAIPHEKNRNYFRTLTAWTLM
jgi:hypothetical protein